MWFNFVTHNHGSLVALEGLAPITDYMRSVLTRCGHEATVSFNELYPDAINVYFEYFPSANFINEILTLKKRGAKIVIIATELIVENQILAFPQFLRHISQRSLMSAFELKGTDLI